MTDISVKLLPSSEIGAVEPLWKNLESSIGDGWMMSSWNWVHTWLKHYGDVIPHQFVVGTRGERVCALALITRQVIKRGPFKINTVYLGTAGEREEESVCVEHNRVLASPEDQRPFARALLAALKKDPMWDELDLDGFSNEDIAPYVELFPALEIERRLTRVFDFTKLKPEEDILPTLSKKTKQKINHSFKAIGEVSVEWAQTEPQAREIFEELQKLHQKRWQSLGKPGAFASDRFRSFHEDLLRLYLPTGAAFCFRARASVGTLGCLYGFIENGRVRFYQSGIAFLEDNKVAPGSITVFLCLQECRKRGFVEFDFLEGDNLYKRQLSNVERYLNWGRLRRPRFKFKVIRCLKKIRNLGVSAAPQEVQ